MSWIDYLTIGIFAVAIVIHLVRGRQYMGAALFNMAALVVAAYASHKVYDRVATILSVSPVIAYALLFVVSGLILVLLAARLHNATQWDFHPFNLFLSLAFGIVAGWAVAYVVLDLMILGNGRDSEASHKITDSRVASEVLTFRTFTGTRGFLDSVRSREPREPWQRRGEEKPSDIR